jgi:hypothetical protein
MTLTVLPDVMLKSLWRSVSSITHRDEFAFNLHSGGGGQELHHASKAIWYWDSKTVPIFTVHLRVWQLSEHKYCNYVPYNEEQLKC